MTNDRLSHPIEISSVVSSPIELPKGDVIKPNGRNIGLGLPDSDMRLGCCGRFIIHVVNGRSTRLSAIDRRRLLCRP